MKALFWFSIFWVWYTYVGFFALVSLLAFLRPRRVNKADVEPIVTLVIAAYNEEPVIREKILNSLRLDYPEEKLEILVAADGSTDRTADIAREYPGVKVLHETERRGKSAALNRAAAAAAGEVFFFSDANTIYAPGALRRLVRNFNDPSVGGVSGRKVVRSDSRREAAAGEKGFWNYEARLKKAETDLGSVSTADGEMFAVRRSLYEAIPPRMVHDDMYLTLKIVQKGFRVVYEWDAVSEEAASKSLRDEFFLKTRYASAGYQILKEFREMLLPPRTWFAGQFLSHKLLRWAAPFPLIAAFVLSALIPSSLYREIFALQCAFYATAVAGFFLTRRGIKNPLLYFPLYFCFGNGAALYGFFKFFRGGQSPLWRKAER